MYVELYLRLMDKINEMKNEKYSFYSAVVSAFIVETSGEKIWCV